MTAVDTHVLGDYLFDYCKSLWSEEIKVEPVPWVIFKAHDGCSELRDNFFRSYHSAIFRFVDSDNYKIEFDEKSLKNKWSHKRNELFYFIFNSGVTKKYTS